MNFITNILNLIKGFFSRKKKKTTTIEVPVLYANIKNLSGRVYSLDNLKSIISQSALKIENKCFVGEMGHSEFSGVSLSRVSHIIDKMWIDGDVLMAKITTSETENGLALASLINNLGGVVFRPKGVGTLNPDGSISDDYMIVSINAITKEDDSFKGLVPENI